MDHHRDLHSFPTRRSSDLSDQGPGPEIRRKMELMICAYSERTSCKTAQMPTCGGTGGSGRGEVPRYIDILVERMATIISPMRSEEHTSELQSHSDLVCRLL